MGVPSCTRGFPVRKVLLIQDTLEARSQRARAENNSAGAVKSVRLWLKKGTFSLVGVMAHAFNPVSKFCKFWDSQG